jgi:hypothetical protein
MIVLANETLETFFDHEFASSFKLTEKATEQQRSLGREIFDNLLATGAKLASTTGVSRPQLSSKSTDVSISTSEIQATIDSIENVKLDGLEQSNTTPETESNNEKEAVESTIPNKDNDQVESSQQKQDEHVLGDDDSDISEEEEDLSPDVLEEVDRLLKEYGDEED